MNRRNVQRLILVVAMLHLAADVAFASSAVLCVGTDGHWAVEAEHAEAISHAPSDSLVGRAGSFLARAATESCRDQPLHPDSAEMASVRIDGSELSTCPGTVLCRLVAPQASDTRSLAAAGLADAAPPGTREHRTTVLLI